MKKRPERLDDEVRRLLEERRGEWQAVADDSKVSFSWISKFVRGEIPNASYTQLQKIKDYLTG